VYVFAANVQSTNGADSIPPESCILAGAYRYLDRRMTLPMRAPVDSLNAAVAAGLLLYSSVFCGARRGE
jgi:hypothetical protein